MQTHNIVISESQRIALVEALRRLPLVHLEPIANEAEDPDDIYMLLDMLDDLPSEERDNPGAIHSLCS